MKKSTSSGLLRRVVPSKPPSAGILLLSRRWKSYLGPKHHTHSQLEGVSSHTHGLENLKTNSSMKITVFWDMTPCSPPDELPTFWRHYLDWFCLQRCIACQIGGHQPFVGSYSLKNGGSDDNLHQWHWTLFFCSCTSPAIPDVISLQLWTPKVVGV
jgi:hypothetical protein